MIDPRKITFNDVTDLLSFHKVVACLIGLAGLTLIVHGVTHVRNGD